MKKQIKPIRLLNNEAINGLAYAQLDFQELLKLLFEHAPVSMAMFDMQMRYVTASHRWLEDFGLLGQDLCGRCHYDVFPEIPDKWKEIHRRCLAGAVERSREDQFERLSGNKQLLNWEIRPWHTTLGEIGGIIIFSEDVTDLKNSHQELFRQKASLERKNAAFKEILEQIEIEKQQIKDNVVTNAENFLLPALSRIKMKGGSSKYIQILRENINNLTSSFGRKISEESLKLTPREIEICNMIKTGLAGKDIARLLNISSLTVTKHRINIRRKLGLTNSDKNLTSVIKAL